MNFFTRDLYDRMQVVGQFGRLKCREDWNELYDICIVDEKTHYMKLIIDKIIKREIYDNEICICKDISSEILDDIISFIEQYYIEWDRAVVHILCFDEAVG